MTKCCHLLWEKGGIFRAKNRSNPQKMHDRTVLKRNMRYTHTYTRALVSHMKIKIFNVTESLWGTETVKMQ